MKLVLACAFGAVLAACGSDSGGAASADAAQMGRDATNGYRQQNGKAPLADSASLRAYAATGAQVDFGGNPHQHFGDTNGGGIAFAENECPHWSLQHEGGGDLGTLVVACIAAFYAEGPGTDYATHGHYINMMGDYATVGIGIYQQGDDVTVTEDFGN